VIRLKNARQLDGIRDSCKLLSAMFKELRPLVVEGVLETELDDFCRKFIVAAGGKPAFLGYEGYPATLCVSVNEKVIHGIPSRRALKQGDLVGLDCGIDLGGYFSDAAITVPVGSVTEERSRLLRTTRECLDLAIAAAVHGNRVHHVSKAVFQKATGDGFGVVRQYCGHGVGFSPHEDPQVPNYVSPGPNPRLVPSMVIALEPMINAGTGDVRLLDDDWTVVTMDGRPSCHFEHTVAIFERHTEVLTEW
jgi:methionyl aminopeptidase